MTIFDYLVIFVMVTSVIIGLVRGLVKEVLSVLSWIIAFIAANAYAAPLAQMLPEAVPGEALRLIVAFLALFIGARILMGLLSLALDALLDAGGLSFIDRVLGAVFGVARGLVIVLAAVILSGMTSLPQQDFWKQAVASPYAEQGVRMVKPYLPAAIAQHVNF